MAIDEAEAVEKVKKYRDKHGLSYPVLLDPKSEVYPKLIGGGQPWNIVLDREGTVRYSGGGFNPEVIKSVVSGLLQAP